MGAIGKREKNKRKERYCIDSYSSAKEDRVLREAQHAKKNFLRLVHFFPGSTFLDLCLVQFKKSISQFPMKEKSEGDEIWQVS